jgi:hypothetical protein
MPLLTPLLKGPLNEWCDTLLVEGAVAGATVFAKAAGPNPRDLAKSVVSGGRNRIQLLPGAKLQPKDVILVRQAEGGVQSDWTPEHLGVPVGPAPVDDASLAPLAFKSRVWECGRRLWLKGAAPGAKVVVSHSSGVIASGRATESGDARMALSAAMPAANNTITAHQGASPAFPPLPGTPKKTSATVEPLPVPTGDELPPPSLGGPPPKGCDTSIMIAGVYDGAEVTILRRSDGSTETSTFDLDRLNFVLGTPLSSQGDKLEIRQAMRECRERRPSDPLHVDVAPARKPGTPALMAPCPGSVDVFVTNLEGGCLVKVTYKGKTYRGTVPPSATSFVCRLPTLEATETITAVQERCGLVSDPGSTTVPGISFSAGLLPDLVEPLFGCARVVRARAMPGAWLQVWVRTPLGPMPISNQVFATKDSVRIHVAPYLHEGQEVFLTFLLCAGAAWVESPSHVVAAAPHVGPVNIVVPPIENTSSVTVDAVPGAAVKVFAITGMPIKVELIGSGHVDPLARHIGLTRLLTPKDVVHAAQWLCSERPGVGGLRTVLPSVRHFSLVAPKSRLSTRNDPKPVVLVTANVTLRHNGVYQFTAFVENQETEADCSVDVQFSLSGVSAPFTRVLSADLSAKNGKGGLALKGVPSSDSLFDQKTFDGFMDPGYWEQVLGATGTFDFLVAWKDYEGSAEAPEEDDDKDDKKDT